MRKTKQASVSSRQNRTIDQAIPTTPQAPFVSAPTAAASTDAAPDTALDDAQNTASSDAAQKGTTMNDTVNTITETARKVAADTQARVETLAGEARTRTLGAIDKSTELFDEASQFAQGNVEAMTESGRIAVAGLQTMGQDMVAFGRRAFEEATATVTSLASAKTATELFTLQGDYARASFDAAVAQASKNSETLVKLMGDAFQPLSNRFAVAAAKLQPAV